MMEAMTIWNIMEGPRTTIWIILILGVLVAFIFHLWARGELRGLKIDIRRTWRKLLRLIR